jgi:GNAT superfamily N-acetyltransferase
MAAAACITLNRLERRAAARGLLLRVQSSRPLGLLHGIRAGVAERQPDGRLRLLGELKGWAWPTADGLHFDTLQVAGRQAGVRDQGVGPLLMAAAFAWALELTPCRTARILAIRDDDRQHRRLVRYFRRLGFTPIRELGAGVPDLAPRLVWGGAGLLMQVGCAEGLVCSQAQLERSWGVSPTP